MGIRDHRKLDIFHTEFKTMMRRAQGAGAQGTGRSGNLQPGISVPHRDGIDRSAADYRRTVEKLLDPAEEPGVAGRIENMHGEGFFDSDHVEMLRTFGQKVFYGDAARLDLLRAAGADTARVLVVAVDDPERIIEIVETARKHFPHLAVLTRAVSRTHAYELLDVGVDDVYRESFDSSIRVAVDVMRKLGIPGHEAHRRGRMFRRHDEKALRELASMRGDHKAYVHGVHQQTEELERTLRADLRDFHPEEDAAWDDESLRREFGETGKA
jgi:voltage-gated potassium channel Kch